MWCAVNIVCVKCSSSLIEINMFVTLTALLFAIIVTIVYVKYTYRHWQRNGILQMSPSFPFGNVGPMLMKTDTFGHSFRHIYEYFKCRNQALGGYYFVLKPELIIVDVELIKCILAKDFTNFMDRGTYIDEQNDPLSAHLFALPGAKWKALRAKLTPTFTSGKMKMMFPTLVACSGQMEGLLENLSRNAEPIDMKDILARFTIDVIGSCAFGIDCNSMKDPDNEFRKFGIASFNIKGFDAVRQALVIVFPKLMQFLRYPGINPKISTFFMNVVKRTISYREKNNVQRNDFLQLLLNIKNQERKEHGETDATGTNAGLTLDQIAAQCFVFFLAGFDTSSTTMTFSLFEMASNQEIQDKVRDEILTVWKKYNGQLTYDAIMELHYMDKVICETLRKYPPLPFINREVTTDYKIPGMECTLRKGTPVVISVEGVHWDPEYYPNPEKFDPERFSEDEKVKRPHYSYLPFGEGPRICIGLRFGLMQTKVGLAVILKNFKCSVNGKTKLPIVMTPESFMTSPEGGIWLDLHKITS